MNRKKLIWTSFGIIALIIVALLIQKQTPTENQGGGSKVIHIVAAENFWGSLISQLGGDKVSVTSIVTDPNADPHEYESSSDDARSFANSDYVILNGAGYDSWSNSLLSASASSTRKVLIVSDLLGKKEGDNPHFWYDPDYVNQVVVQMENDLIVLDPADADYFKAQYQMLQSSLAEYQNKITNIKKNFAGTKVASTEDIFVYLGEATELDLVSPPEFILAVGEGNDPSAQSVVEFENQLKNKEPKILVYNEQTVTPVTESVKKLAASESIPVVGITETIQPAGMKFQDWMDTELVDIENALVQTAGHK
jgi:zinc/manganese transport system substrate-binding protein